MHRRRHSTNIVAYYRHGHNDTKKIVKDENKSEQSGVADRNIIEAILHFYCKVEDLGVDLKTVAHNSTDLAERVATDNRPSIHLAEKNK